MSNKNVEIVKELIQEYKTYGDLDGIQDLNIYINSLEELLAEREQMLKPINTIEKDIRNIKYYINLVLNKGYCDCNELNVISTGKYCDGSKNVACSMQNLLVEREQDKKRIKELEEENAILKKASNIAKDVNIEDVTEIMNKSYKEFMSNYIPKQVVIDVIQEYKDKTEKYNEYRVQSKETDVEYYENIANTIVVQVLQELLEGERK